MILWENQDQAYLRDWFQKRSQFSLTLDFRVLGFTTSYGVLSGCTGYDNFTGTACEVHMVILSDYLPKKFIWAGFDYPFNQMGCSVIYGRIPSSNHRAVRLAERLGFRREAVIRGAYPNGDMLIFTMHKHECKWLELKRHVKQQTTTPA